MYEAAGACGGRGPVTGCKKEVLLLLLLILSTPYVQYFETSRANQSYSALNEVEDTSGGEKKRCGFLGCGFFTLGVFSSPPSSRSSLLTSSSGSVVEEIDLAKIRQRAAPAASSKRTKKNTMKLHHQKAVAGTAKLSRPNVPLCRPRAVKVSAANELPPGELSAQTDPYLAWKRGCRRGRGFFHHGSMSPRPTGTDLRRFQPARLVGE